MKLWVVLPAYDEAPRLPRLLARWHAIFDTLAFPATLVIVDDGSSDETPSILLKARDQYPERTTVLTHERNQGLGRTLADGLTAVAEWGAPEDVVVMMDADNTQAPELAPLMLDRLSEGADVVIASRFRRGAQITGLSLFRRALSIAALTTYMATYRLEGVRDYTCGYRAYRVELLQRALASATPFFELDGFECQVDTLVKLDALGARFAEVPLELDYSQKAGQSHMRVGQTIARSLKLVWSRLRGQ